MKLSKPSVALFIALLFHVSGLIGILFTPYKNWFIQNTALNLFLMFLLLVWVQEKKNSVFFLFLVITFVTGFFTEMLGVNTALLFGNYRYGNVLGPKVKQVPLLIGINWFVVVYCCGVMMQNIDNWTKRKYEEAGAKMSPVVSALSFIMDGALLATFFDWIMEPVAVKLGFWTWQNDTISYFNYLCWYFISMLLLIVFRILNFNKHNHFAVHLFIIQVLFFLVLRTFL